MMAISEQIEVLHKKLTDCLNRVKLEVAGRVIFYDVKLSCFILAMHSTSPEKTLEATSLAWGSIPNDLKAELKAVNIGFAGRQI